MAAALENCPHPVAMCLLLMFQYHTNNNDGWRRVTRLGLHQVYRSSDSHHKLRETFQRNAKVSGEATRARGEAAQRRERKHVARQEAYRFCEGVISAETLSSWYFLIAKRSRA